MIRKNWIMSLFALLLILTSCRKPALDIDKTFEGSWIHYYGENMYEYLVIQNNSRGAVEHYEGGMIGRSLKFKWLIKNNKLYHGWLETKGHYVIDKYPTIAETMIIDNFDTIPIGKMYMILDGAYYLKYFE